MDEYLPINTKLIISQPNAPSLFARLLISDIPNDIYVVELDNESKDVAQFRGYEIFNVRRELVLDKAA